MPKKTAKSKPIDPLASAGVSNSQVSRPEAVSDARPAVPKFTSDYGILDVLKGRKQLRKYLKEHGPVRVCIVAELTEPFGQDDGTSIEFNMNVIGVVA